MTTRQKGYATLFLGMLAGCGKPTTEVHGNLPGLEHLSAPLFAVYNRDDYTAIEIVAGAVDCNPTTPGSAFTLDGGVGTGLYLRVYEDPLSLTDTYEIRGGLTASYTPGGPIVPPSEQTPTYPPSPEQITYVDATGAQMTGYYTAFSATSGHVHFSHEDDPKKSDATAEGDFELQFPDGGELSGTFHATPCATLPAASGCSAVGGASLLPLLVLAGAWRRRAVSRAG